MRLDMERICQLAGVKNTSKTKTGYGVLSENRKSSRGNFLREEKHDDDDTDEGGMYEKEKHDDDDDDADEGMEEMIEVDEAMLVQELRRVKRIMQESKNQSRQKNRQQKLFEAQLKRVIDEEVQNVMEELHLTSGWVYGDRKPTRSRAGYTHQGRTLPGLGFSK